MNSPGTDADVPAWWRGLGLPGLFDVHVHFLPPPIMARVWDYFDAAGPLIGRPWPITYRFDDEVRVDRLRSLGVRSFTSLPYAHKPGVARYLNDWAAQFSRQTPECLSSATFYPEADAAQDVADRLAAGTQIFKTHIQVGDFDPNDPLLDGVWGQLEDSRTPVVIHAGSGPVGNVHTGPAPLKGVLARFPRLVAIIAHMGAPDYEDFIGLADAYDNVRLDTTMAFTDFFEEGAPFPHHLKPRLLDLQDKILLGSDFPNIPYPYAHQLQSLERMDLGDDWLRAVCWGNGTRLFGGAGD